MIPIEVVLINRNINVKVDSPLTVIRWNTRGCNCEQYVAQMEELASYSPLSE